MLGFCYGKYYGFVIPLSLLFIMLGFQMSSDSDLSIICCYLFVIVLCYDLYCYCYSLWSLLRPLFFFLFVVSVVAMISFNLVICYWYSLFLLPSSCYLVVSYFLCYCSLSRSLLVLVIVLCVIVIISLIWSCYQLFQYVSTAISCFNLYYQMLFVSIRYLFAIAIAIAIAVW